MDHTLPVDHPKEELGNWLNKEGNGSAYQNKLVLDFTSKLPRKNPAVAKMISESLSKGLGLVRNELSS